MKILPIIASLTLLACTTACQLQDPDAGLRVEDVIDIKLTDSVLLADGRDLITLEAVLGPQASPNLEVTFSTALGQFESSLGNNVTELRQVASGRSATATIIAGTQVQDRVAVSAAVTADDPEQGRLTFQATKILVFERAYPSQINLSLLESSLAALVGASTDLTVALSRPNGRVSNDTEVGLAVIPLGADAPVIEVPAEVTLSGEIATVPITVADTLSGEVNIRAWVLTTGLDTAARADIRLEVFR